MAIRAVPKDRTKVRYHVYAYYKLYAHYYLLQVYRDTIEDCYKWLDEHKTKSIQVTFDTCKEANIVSYLIMKEVIDVKVIESKKFKKK